MGARNTVPADVRAAIEAELLEPRDPPRSRAAIAAEHDVSPRTINRYATALGIPPEEAWKTDVIRAATEAATDRRRHLRSQLADELLNVEVPALRELLARGHAGGWRKTIALPGVGSDQVDEDDYNVARGAAALHGSIKTAIDTTIAIDRHDQGDGDDEARKALGNLFGALAKGVEQGLDPDPRPGDDEPGDDTDDEEGP